MLNTKHVLLAGFLAVASQSALAADKASCTAAIESADAALAEAEASGAVEAVAVAEASTLIAAAKVQRTFGEFSTCVSKANRAKAQLQ